MNHLLFDPLEDGYIACFENGWAGANGIVAGLQSIIDGKERTIVFVAAVHPKAERTTGREVGEITACVRIGIAKIDGTETFRICGEGGDPLGTNSRNLAGGSRRGEGRTIDLAIGAANLVNHLMIESGNTASVGIYRQPDFKLQTRSFEFRGYEVIVTSHSHTQHSYSVYEKGVVVINGADATESWLNKNNGCKNPYLKSNWTIMQEIAKGVFSASTIKNR